MVNSSQWFPIRLTEAPDEAGRGLKDARSPRRRSDPEEPKGRQCNEGADLEEGSACCLLEQQPAGYYLAVAARARRLQMEATTPRLKQYLDEMISRCEQLVEEVGMITERRQRKSGISWPAAI